MQKVIVPRALGAVQRALFVRSPVKGALRLPRQCVKRRGSCARVRDINEAICFGKLPEAVDEDWFGDVECAPPHLCTVARVCPYLRWGAG